MGWDRGEIGQVHNGEVVVMGQGCNGMGNRWDRSVMGQGCNGMGE